MADSALGAGLAFPPPSPLPRRKGRDAPRPLLLPPPAPPPPLPPQPPPPPAAARSAGEESEAEKKAVAAGGGSSAVLAPEPLHSSSPCVELIHLTPQACISTPSPKNLPLPSLY
ncbi:hypothetical protein J1605_016193 [Eschrichtius robustus]|uniref:Uncharacterized protein n=1 Tax=Eschrichtius robustus TaxID=9764 RepID=A0AB34G9Z4_ESCRO|nr:hypothetical protein J1605_016193 [Eschrichtius robustus]